MLFICFGQCFHIILPAMTITMGMIKSHSNINHQKHITFTSKVEFDRIIMPQPVRKRKHSRGGSGHRGCLDDLLYA